MPTESIQQYQPTDDSAAAIGQYPYPDEKVISETKKSYEPADVLSRLNAWFSMTNIADSISDDRLAQIGRKVVDDYENDKNSRIEWEKEQKQIKDIAQMTMEVKTWAGRICSNVKFPMILRAAVSFASRSYAEIVKGKDVVKCSVIGKDADGKKAAKAARVSAHMSYQLLEEMDWEAELDQLLMIYCITGSGFKKTYYCPIENRNVSELVMADDLVIDYWCKDINKASRITHVIEMNQNDIFERIQAGVFRKNLTIDDFGKPEQEIYDQAQTAHNDDDAPHTFLEQHRWLDLDEDGYQEPYIVTVHKQSAIVVRICARYDLDGIKTGPNGEVIKIEPVQYFTHYKFMPSIDGGFYGIGLGKLLFGLNNAVNAMLNQLIDAGTAANRMSGFIGRGVQLGRTHHGTDGFALGVGEWKAVPSTGDDLRKNIVPMPSKEPSPVLFQLMQFLIDTGKDISSSSDILSGESPGPNVPAASTLALIEQGIKVFSGIFKRLYRSLKDEFKKIARLNRMYLPEEHYFAVLDDEFAILADDYNDQSLDIVPVADPNNLSDVGRAMKIQALMALSGKGLNDIEIQKRYLQSLNIERPEELLPQNSQESQPNPFEAAKIAETEAKIELTKAQVEKVKTEIQVMSAGVVFDQEKLRIEKAQVLNNIEAREENGKVKNDKNIISRFNGQNANKTSQGAYHESGMQSNNNTMINSQ